MSIGSYELINRLGMVIRPKQSIKEWTYPVIHAHNRVVLLKHIRVNTNMLHGRF